ncbi:MAG: sulfurtransferase [Hyphomicrobiales bacterium]|nr:sulfurtransferase [Hyphomicrobiales bacterium]
MPDARYRYPEAIVTADWLAARLDDPDLRVYDCTTYLEYESGTGRPYRVVSGRADYDAGHIPGSAFLDLQGQLSDNASPFRFTLPPWDVLAAAFGAAGLGDGCRAVLYSRRNIQWATRIWWMLRALGFDAAAVLDGGWETWSQSGHPVSTAPAAHPPAVLTPRPRPDLFTGKREVLDAVGDPGTCTINALGRDLHAGENPRYGRPGRIPGSVNVPAMELQDPDTLRLPAAADAAAAFAAVGARPEQRVILYCGGGIAATLDAFLLHQLGFTDLTVYDNSLNEWAQDERLPLETG